MNDERLKQLMAQVGMPNSVSLKQALEQAHMEGELKGRAHPASQSPAKRAGG